VVRTPLVSALFGLSTGAFIALCTSIAEVVLRGASFADLLGASPAMWVIWSMPALLGLAVFQIATHSAARERPVPWARPVPPPPIPVATLAATPPSAPDGLRTVEIKGSPTPAMARPRTVQDDGMGGLAGDERLEAMAERIRVLKEEVQRAASGGRAKSAYLAALGPVLRGRLSWILGDAELLLDGADPARAPELRRLVESARELSEIVGNVVDLSKIEVGQLPISVEDVDLAQIAEEVRALIGPLAAEHHTAFSARVAAGARQVRADPFRVRQILLELLSNAVRITTHGQIQLVIERATPKRDAWVALHVQDTGRGMDPDELERALDAYVEGASRVAAGSRSGGIGLAIARQLAELMGGRLDVQSDPGIGTKFTLLLPPPPATVQLPGRRSGVPVHERLSGAPVWVVDGEPGGVVLARTLQDARLTVRHLVDVASATAAVRASTGERPAVVVVDAGLLDAWDFVEDLVLGGANVLVTSVRDEDAVEARRLGARAFLLRPVDRRWILPALERCVDPAPEPVTTQA
jgi:signal transduction histidine kinase